MEIDSGAPTRCEGDLLHGGLGHRYSSPVQVLLQSLIELGEPPKLQFRHRLLFALAVVVGTGLVGGRHDGIVEAWVAATGVLRRGGSEVDVNARRIGDLGGDAGQLILGEARVMLWSGQRGYRACCVRVDALAKQGAGCLVFHAVGSCDAAGGGGCVKSATRMEELVSSPPCFSSHPVAKLWFVPHTSASPHGSAHERRRRRPALDRALRRTDVRARSR